MGDTDQLRVDVRHEADRIVVGLEGELDLANAALLQRAIERAGLETQPMLVLDLQRLQFIDSTGLRIVLSLREGALARGQEFAVTPGSEQVQRLLSLTGVAEHLRTIATPDELAV